MAGHPKALVTYLLCNKLRTPKSNFAVMCYKKQRMKVLQQTQLKPDRKAAMRHKLFINKLTTTLLSNVAKRSDPKYLHRNVRLMTWFFQGQQAKRRRFLCFRIEMGEALPSVSIFIYKVDFDLIKFFIKDNNFHLSSLSRLPNRTLHLIFIS